MPQRKRSFVFPFIMILLGMTIGWLIRLPALFYQDTGDENIFVDLRIERDYSVAGEDIVIAEDGGPAIKSLTECLEEVDISGSGIVIRLGYWSPWPDGRHGKIEIAGNGECKINLNEKISKFRLEPYQVKDLIVNIVDSGFLGINNPLLFMKHELCVGRCRRFQSGIDATFVYLTLDLYDTLGTVHTVGIFDLKGMLENAKIIPEYARFKDAVNLVEGIVPEDHIGE